ncbi:unnamed protein product [Mytilus edulis]|uniref:Uncharacterized protein n=1 Tax=Mytilus edulis TaxID=6550 RepID=A0A8S3VF93_MYTED|nr:unnamed protein product [Mytilus edulis]
MAIPLLSPAEFTSVVIPSGILTDEEQSQMLKYATISNSDSLCGKFRVHPRKGGRVVEVSIDNIVNPKNQSDDIYVGIFSQEGTHLHPESLYVKANKRIKIKSVTLNPQFIKPCQNKYNFNVDFETVTSMQNTCVRPSGRACKLPIDKVIPQNEILILTIKPNPPNQYPYDWESKQHHLKSLPQTFAVKNGMMYEHELSQRTTLFLALKGGYLVESFEVMELC